MKNVQIMGVLNVTPDSFSDGGLFTGLDEARIKIASMIHDGADIIDVGGESTRPGASSVSIQQELDRVIPVVALIQKEFDIKISVDTSTPEVMTEAAASGAFMINDVRALSRSGAMQAAKLSGLDICLMHMQGRPMTMQDKPAYSDVVVEVYDYLLSRVVECELSGIPRNKLVLDPGFGFGKSLEHNIQLLSRLDEFSKIGLPLLVGLSRKTMIGQLTDKPVSDRMAGSISAAVLAVCKGANIIRVHDVAETSDAIKVASAVLMN